MAGTITLRLRISGRVQGVGYRAWTSGQAKQLGLNGWVRNRTDGTVEALLNGEKEAARQMVELCRSGPMTARVDEIVETAEDATEIMPGFIQLPTL